MQSELGSFMEPFTNIALGWTVGFLVFTIISLIKSYLACFFQLTFLVNKCINNKKEN